MTMIRMIGGETGDNEFDYNAGVVVSTTGERSGSYSYTIGGPNIVSCILSPEESELYIQVGVYVTAFGISQGTFFKWFNGTTVLGFLNIDDVNRVFRLYTSTGTLVGTGTKKLSLQTNYLLELRIKIADATGVPETEGKLELRVDGITDITFAGDTKPGADTGINTLSFSSFVGSGSYVQLYIDDIIVNNIAGSVNNSWPNGAKVVALFPNGAGSSNQYTPSAGSNYQNVEEIPPTLVENNNTNTDAQLDLFAMSDLPAEAYSIQGIKNMVTALKQGVPAVPNIKTAYKVSGYTARLSSNHALSFSAAVYADIVETNLDSALAWTIADINALESGYKSAT